MNLLVGALSVGLLLSLLTLGVFLTYRVLNRLDLTTDGSFGLGAAVAAALLAHGVHPVTATILATVSGWLAGAATGVVHTAFGVDTLLGGILVSTALYSVQLYVMQGGDVSLEHAIGELGEHGAPCIGLAQDRGIDVLPLPGLVPDDAPFLEPGQNRGDGLLGQSARRFQGVGDVGCRRGPAVPEHSEDGELEIGKGLRFRHAVDSRKRVVYRRNTTGVV